MKNVVEKSFIIAAACLVASISWAAEVTFTMSDIFDGQKLSFDVTSPVSAKVSSNTSKGNAPQGKLGSTNNYFEIILNNETYSSAKINGYINTTNTSGYDWGFQFSTDKGATWSQTVSQPNDGNKTVHEITVNATIPANANGFRVVRLAGTSTVVASVVLNLDGGGGTPVTPTVNSVTVSPASVTLDPNGTQQLTATVDATPASADKSVTWTSSDPSVATVSESGLVTAVAQGTATITATSNLDNTKSGTCNITVNAPAAPIPVTAIALNKSTTTIAIGDSETLTINYTPADANTGKAVNWTSSNTSVATVDNSGKVIGVTVGTATITATSTTDASITASCAVTIQAVAVTGVSINPTSANLQIGGSTDLTYTILPANATDKSVSWSSSNTAVATVNDGHVTALTAGTATITVTTTDGNKTATCSVTVTAGPPVPHTTLTTHVPEIYEAKDIAGGYGGELSVIGGREYEVFYAGRYDNGGTKLTIHVNPIDKSHGVTKNETSNAYEAIDGWFKGTGNDKGTGFAIQDEFNKSTDRCHNMKSSNSVEMHIQGYDQFSLYGMDKKINPSKPSEHKVFKVLIDDVEQTMVPSTSATIRRFDITTGEHVIKIQCGDDCLFGGFSLRVAQEPRVKREKGNDSAQVVLATTAIQPIVYSTKYNNIPGAETRLTWIGAQPAGIDTTMRLGELKDTIIIGGIANCEAGEYNYEIAAYYNDVKKNSLTGKFFVKTDIKSITSTNATVYQNEEMDQIEFKYYALSAENVILTWTGTKPVGITGNGNNGTYLIGGTPTQTGEYTYSITVQGADTTITGKITVRELDYGTNPVLYLYKNENAYESDGVRNYLKDNGWNPIERKAKKDGLRPDDQYAVYKLVVISEDVDANNQEVQQIIKENGAKQPVLNLKGFTYAKGEGLLGWGDPSNGAIDSTKNSKAKGTKIKIQHADHPIFKNISNIKEGDEISILSNYALQGVMPIAIDMQYITDQTLCMGTAPIRKNTLNGYYDEGEWVAAIHEILPSARGGKKYICLPLARNVTLTTTGERLIKGIVDYLVSPTPTTITAPDLLITGFSVKDDKNNEYTATIDQTEHTIKLRLTPEEYQALDSLKEVKPIITHPNYTSVDPASGEEVKLTYAYLRPQKYIITDFINKNVYDFILELYNPQGIEEVYEAGQWVNIFDIYGRKVATTNEDIYTMELPHGMYIIVTESGETMKIMK
ncbi:MAG: Ig-like domain-containing protein [Paludibacteraceae bacterium]|nr:Ig-like domain-containing protein [Paludibacteraceae bacterium]